MSNKLEYDRTQSNDEQYPLTRTELCALCEEFVLITNTDVDFAMIILQENQWNLNQAINAYLNKPKSPIKKFNSQYSTLSVSFFYQVNNFSLLSSQ
jgi:hypothetical protein